MIEIGVHSAVRQRVGQVIGVYAVIEKVIVDVFVGHARQFVAVYPHCSATLGRFGERKVPDFQKDRRGLNLPALFVQNVQRRGVFARG